MNAPDPDGTNAVPGEPPPDRRDDAEASSAFSSLGRARGEVAHLVERGALTYAEAVALRTTLVNEESALLTRAEPHGAEDLRRIVENAAPHLTTCLHRAYERGQATEAQSSAPPVDSIATGAASNADAASAVTAPVPPVPRAPRRRPTPECRPPRPARAPRNKNDVAVDEPDRWRMSRFLETVSIRWGLLASALLIVGCSIALVVTLWQSESFAVRYGTFLAVTVALSFAGQFAVRRLQLRSTGAALVAVASMMMPLGLIAADFTAVSGAVGAVINETAHVPGSFRLVLFVAFSVLSFVSFRTLAGPKTHVFAATFSLLMLGQLILGVTTLPVWTFLTWVVAGVYLIGMRSVARHMEGLDDQTIPGAGAGLLAFAYALIPVRLAIEYPLEQALLGPFGALGLGGLVLVARQLRGKNIAPILRTVLHLALPAAFLSSWMDNPLPPLATALCLAGIYGLLAVADRSRAALLATASAVTFAVYAGFVWYYGAPTFTHPWLPNRPPPIALAMLPFVGITFVVTELSRRTWAERSLRTFAFTLLGVMGFFTLFDADVAARGMIGIGAAAATLFAITRRRDYAYFAAGAAPAVLAIDPSWLTLSRTGTAIWLGALAVAYAAAGSLLSERSAGTSSERRRRASRALLDVAVATGALAALFAARFDAPNTSSPAPFALITVALTAVGIRRRSHPLLITAGLAFAATAALSIEHWIGTFEAPTGAHVLALLGAGALPFAWTGLRSGFLRPHLVGWASAFTVAALCVAWLTVITPLVIAALLAGAAFSLWMARRETAPALAALVALFVLTASFFTFHLIEPIPGLGVGLRSVVGVAAPRWLAFAPLVASFVLLALARWQPAPFQRVFGHATLATGALTLFLLLSAPEPRKLWVIAGGLALLTFSFRRAIRDHVTLRATTFVLSLSVACGLVADVFGAPRMRVPWIAMATMITAVALSWRAAAPKTYVIGLRLWCVLLAGIAIVAAAVLHVLGGYAATPALPWLTGAALALGLAAQVRVHHRDPSALALWSIAILGAAILVWSTVPLGTWSVHWLPFAFVAFGAAWRLWGRLDEDPAAYRISTTAFLAAAFVASSSPLHAGTLAAAYLATGCAILARHPGWIAGLAFFAAYAQLQRLLPLMTPAFPIDVDSFIVPHLTAFAGTGLLFVGLWETLHRRTGAAAYRIAAVLASFAALVPIGIVAMHGEPDIWHFDLGVGAMIIVGVAGFYATVAVSDRRAAFVYLAEGAIAALFGYLHVTHPWLFTHPWAKRAWPLVMVGLAFAAVGLGASVRRRDGFEPLAKPLESTGLVLPVGTLIAVWFGPAIDHVTVAALGCVAAFYALTSWTYGNAVLGYFACGVANVAVATLVHVIGVDVTVHPQLYFAPAGTTLIAIAYWRERSLSAQAAAALRFIGTAILFGSLATAVFTDAAHQTLEMFALALLCILGILLGIGFRVRAFLYAGIGFLAFDVAYMIFRAGREDTWIWWVSGITLGVLVMFGFALAERYRRRLRVALRELRSWS